MKINNKFNQEKFITFLLSIIILYIIYYIIASKLHWEIQIKTLSQHYQNITNLILLSTILYVFGNYNETWNFMMLFISFISMFVYGYIGEFSFLKNSISITDINRLNNNAKIVYTTTFLIIIIISFYHIKLSYNENIMKTYIFSFLIIIITYLIIPYYIYKNEKDITFHPHHWLIVWILALFTRFDTFFSKLCGAICIGIFIQGSSAFNNSNFFGSIFNH